MFNISHLKSTWEEFEDFAKDKNLSGKRVLDVGCRDDKDKEFFEQFGLEWTGTDKNPKEGSKYVIKAEMEMFGNDNPFLRKYDIIFVCHSLEHSENPLKALKNIYNLLTQNGWLFISLPCYCKYHILDCLDDDHIFVFTKWQILKLLRYIGFKQIKIFNSKKGGYEGTKRYNMIAIGRKNE